ncbi:hypothetical protein KR018_006174, partial [Drosophila ironensis]
AFACHCIRLKECSTFARLLLHHKAGEQSAVHAKVHAASCGFHGLELLVCCPSSRKSYRDDSSSTKAGRMLRFAPPDERWIWDAGSERKGKHSQSSHKSPLPFHAAETDLHDYWNFEEQRNCPQPLEPEFLDHRFGSEGHHFHYHVEHGGKNHVSERPNPEDKPIVFPGDLRFLRQGIEDGNFDGPPLAPFTTTTPASPTITPTSLPASSTPPQTATNNQQNRAGCGISVESRLLGGEQANAAQYPWLARIGYRNRTSGRISYRCSGSLISTNYIATAAHCVVNLVSDLELSHVRFGDDDAVTPFAIQERLVHPNYDQPRYSNDIALLRLNGTTGSIAPICLPLNSTPAIMQRLVGQAGVAAGWSTISPESESRNRLGNSTTPGVRFIRLPIVNTTSCATAYASLSENFQQPIVINPSHLCAQGQPMNDVCRGDSGGPFMDDGSSGIFGVRERYTLIGIIAFGPTLCGVSTIPGVYTRVSSFTDWIVQSISDRTVQ